MSVTVKYPLEFFVQLAATIFGTEGVGQGSPHSLKALLMKDGFVFDEVNHTFANTGIVRLATPAISALVETTGVLNSGTYYYRVSAINSVGETLVSAVDSVSIGATKGVQISWGAVDGATGYRIYGRSVGSQLFLKEVTGVTTWTDDGSLTPSGAQPSEDSTGEELETGNGYTANSEVIGALTLQRNEIDKFYEILIPQISWTPVGTLGPASGLIILDDSEASLADKWIIGYVDFGGTKSETAPTDFIIPSQRMRLKGFLTI